MQRCKSSWRRRNAESAARAGFESLAAERERPSRRLTAERDGVRAELHETGARRSALQAARISQLEADLNNERKNLAEKLALLETAKQALADQFQALASDILEQKSKVVLRRQSEGTRHSPHAASRADRGFPQKSRRSVSPTRKPASPSSRPSSARLERSIRQLTEEARNLTTALRGSAKAQGDWGEFILRDLLDKAGLREGEQYGFQQSFAG